MKTYDLIVPRVPEPKSRRIDEIYYRESSRRSRQEELDTVGLIPPLAAFNDKLLIDVACGCGGHAAALASRFTTSQVIGVDVNPQAIAIARQRYQRPELPNIEFRVLNAYYLSRDFSGMATLITSRDSLHHFDNLENLLEQIRKSLAPGGFFCFSDLDRKSFRLLERDAYLFVYQARISMGDEAFMDFLYSSALRQGDREEALFNSINLISLMAAYTIEEVNEALDRAGLRLLDHKPADERFLGISRRVSDQ